MDTTLTEWKIGDYLKTPEDRALFIEAALEEAVMENDPGIFSDALAAVAKHMGGKSDRGFVAVMMAVSSGIDTVQAMLAGMPRAVKTTARRARPAKRELARA
nr:MAG TPA: hypothetical protein [Caudoviricetes sp.]